MLSQKVIWQNVLTSNLILKLCFCEDCKTAKELKSVDETHIKGVSYFEVLYVIAFEDVRKLDKVDWEVVTDRLEWSMELSKLCEWNYEKEFILVHLIKGKEWIYGRRIT